MTIPNRFRYRLWDEGANRHCSAETIRALGLTLSPDGKILFKCVGETHESTCFTPEFSTGLLDKNGKEIFEGDIIRDPGYLEQDVEFTWRWVIEWNEGVSFGGPRFLASGEALQNFREIEVVGNIYENPELLEKKDEHS